MFVSKMPYGEHGYLHSSLRGTCPTGKHQCCHARPDCLSAGFCTDSAQQQHCHLKHYWSQKRVVSKFEEFLE